MSDFAFNRALKGIIDHEYLCQAYVYWVATDFDPVVFLCYRKETSAMVEIIFSRNQRETLITQTLTGDPCLLAKEDPILLTEIKTPFDPSVEDYVRERICYLKDVQSWGDKDSIEGKAETVRLSVPGADAVTEEVENIQGKDKAIARAIELGCAVPERNGSWYALKTGRRLLDWPCSYCAYKNRCFPNTKLEIVGDRPKWVVP